MLCCLTLIEKLISRFNPDNKKTLSIALLFSHQPHSLSGNNLNQLCCVLPDSGSFNEIKLVISKNAKAIHKQAAKP